MELVFYSNVLNNHQIALCDELYRRIKGNFYFVEISMLNETRKSMGFKQFERPYLIRLNNEENRVKAKELARNSDVAIMGAESFEYLKLRIKHNVVGITFSYSERWLKKGFKNILSPRIMRQIALYMQCGWKRKWFMLCASGFLAQDLKRLGIFRNRCYKWGYFPNYSSASLPIKDISEPIKIIWVGRFIDWKHPEYMVSLADHLNNRGYPFEMLMIGDGPERENIISALEEHKLQSGKFRFPGNLPNAEVIEKMRCSDILCFTSNKREGWGAVLGEGMSNGSCPVASSDAGATPFLIKNGFNGLIYQSGNESDFIEKVKYLIENREECKKMGIEARKTMIKHWSAEVAAKNLYLLAQSKLGHIPSPHFKDEPCSSC